jgi:HSP20 family protein
MALRRLSKLNIELIGEELARIMRLMDKMENPVTDGAIPVDVWMSDSEVTVRFEVPGADPDKLRLTGTPTLLEIAGTTPATKPPVEGRYLIAERPVGLFRKAVEMPAPVNLTDVNAHYANGVMTIILKRIADRRNRRHKISFNIEKQDGSNE